MYNETDALSAIFAIFFGMIAIIFIIAIISIIVQGIPLYKMAKNRGINYPWLAFIPYGNTYVMLNIPTKPFNFFDVYVLSDRKQLFLMYLAVTLGGSFLVNILSSIPVIGLILALAYFVLTCLLSYQITKDIYDTYETNNTTLLAVLSMFVPFMQLIMLYIYMNRTPIDYNTNNYTQTMDTRFTETTNNKQNLDDSYNIDNDSNEQYSL